MDTFEYTHVRESVIRIFREAGGTRPDVLQVVIDGQDYVIKDYNPTSGWFGSFAGPFLVRREIRALYRLQGLAGIPVLYGCTDRRVLVTSWCDARPASRLERTLDWPAFESRLKDLIRAMHSRGVAHCDLRGPGNILINEADMPYLVDYVACVLRGPSWNRPWEWIFRQACKADDSAVTKLKARIAPELITDQERLQAGTDSSKGRLFRKTSRGLRRFARWVFAAGKN